MKMEQEVLRIAQEEREARVEIEKQKIMQRSAEKVMQRSAEKERII